MPSPSNNESPSQKTFRPADQQTLTPVTIRMLWNADQGSDEVFRVDGQALVQVTFLGKVLSTDTSNNTNVAYKIDDGTGIMDVKVWLENDDAGMTQARDVEEPGTYVRVYGHLRQWQKSLNVVAFRMKPLDSFDELTYHYLEVIRVHLHNTKGPLPPVDPNAPMSTPVKAPGAQVGAFGGPSPSPSAVKPDPYGSSFNELQTAILQVIGNAVNKDLGAHRNDIYNSCSSRWATPTVVENLQWLVGEGHVFTTMDDDHYSTSLQF